MQAPNFPFSAAQVACWLVATASTCWDADGCNIGDGVSHKTCRGRLALDALNESMALGVDPEELMVRDGKGGVPSTNAMEWRVVAPGMFVLRKLKGCFSTCGHHNEKAITYPYDPFEWRAAQTQGAEKAALRLWHIVHPAPTVGMCSPPAPDAVPTRVPHSSRVDQQPGVRACFRRPNGPHIRHGQ
jgi:hypothetical protein